MDACWDHESLLAAASVCELLGEGCGGVTAVLGRGPFQTRAARSARPGPKAESSWLKRSCDTRDDSRVLSYHTKAQYDGDVDDDET